MKSKRSTKDNAACRLRQLDSISHPPNHQRKNRLRGACAPREVARLLLDLWHFLEHIRELTQESRRIRDEVRVVKGVQQFLGELLKVLLVRPRGFRRRIEINGRQRQEFRNGLQLLNT